MGQVLGLGGVFFKAKDPKALIDWYNAHLGMSMAEWGAQLDVKALPPGAYNVFSPFKEETTYFEPSRKDFMINLVVDDVKACLDQVKRGGATVMDDTESSEYGTFGWFMDPAGNKIELWQPPEPA